MLDIAFLKHTGFCLDLNTIAQYQKKMPAKEK
jgi:hypothetical protein